MMRYSKAIFFISSLLLLSCSKEINSVQTPKIDTAEEQKFGPEIVLGEKLNNPYSLSNMQAAYESLVRTKSGEGIEVEELEANWLYVRVLPKDSTDVSFLIDSGLELFDYPLDYEIEVYGNSYHDPSIPEDEITWQYTRVRPDFHFPETTQYEVLDECYIPEDDIETKSGIRFNQSELEITAIENAGYKIDEASLTKGSAAQHCPSGFVKMEQTARNFIPAKGVKVRCNYFLKIGTTYTFESGFYYINTFFYVKPHYHIVFENEKDFVLWKGVTGVSPASWNYGRFAMNGHDFNIKMADDEWKFATINNAGYDYYKKSKEIGIPKPRDNFKVSVIAGKVSKGAWGATPMLRRIAAVGIDTQYLAADILADILAVPISSVLLFVFKTALPDMLIYTGWLQNDYYDILYYLTWHEFSHSSHFEVAGREYWHRYASYILSHGFTYGNKNSDNSDIVDLGESWANAYTSYIYSLSHSSVKYYDEGTFESGEYFNSYPLTDLMENKTLSPAEILNCMTSKVRSIDDLKSALISKYSSKKDDISSCFSSYGL